MAGETSIEWCRNTDGSRGHTFNPWIGCEKVAPECAHCYAEVSPAAAFKRVAWGPGHPRHVAAESTWAGPLAWDARHQRTRTRGRVFCASLSDLFEERADLDAPRLRLLALVALTPHLDWLLLTKRPWHMARVLNDPGTYERVLVEANRWRQAHPRRHLSRYPVDDPRVGWNNLWAGTTAGTQASADRNLGYLLQVPAREHFVSCEPLLQHVDLRLDVNRGVSWVISGGESGHRARAAHPVWFRSLRKQATAAGVAYLHKQNGAFVEVDGGAVGAPGLVLVSPDGRRSPWTGARGDGDALMRRVGKEAGGRALEGRVWDEFPIGRGA